MAIKDVGVNLVANNYATYIKQVKTVNAEHKKLSRGLTKISSDYKKAATQIKSDSRGMAASTKSSGVELDSLRAKFRGAGTSAHKFSTGVDTAQNTIEHFRRVANGSNTALGRLKLGFSNVGGSVRNFGSNIMAGASGLKSFGSNLLGMIPSFIKWLGILTAIMKAWQFFKQSGDIAQRNETLAVTLNTMGKAAGYSKEQIDAATESLKKQGITTSASSQSLIRMSRANISWAEASKLAAIAQGSAVAAGMDSSAAFERLILGIQKMEPELLDELGITLQRSEAYKAFAKDLGVSETALNRTQKQQAILNEIYRQSEDVIKVYDAAMETSGKRQGSLTRHIEEAQASLGKLLLPFKELSVDMRTEFWKGIRKVAKGLESWIPIIRAVTGAFVSIRAIMFKDTTGIIEKLTGIEVSFDNMGRGAHNWAQVIVQVGSMVGAALDTVKDNFEDFKTAALADLMHVGKAWFQFTTMNFAGLAETLKEDSAIKELGSGLGDEFAGNFMERMDRAKEAMPDLFKSWEEISKEIDTDIDLNLPGMDEATDNLEEQKTLLEAQIKAYEKINDIIKGYAEQVSSIKDAYAEGLESLGVESTKAEAKLAEKTEKAKAKAASDGAKRRTKLIDDFNRKAVKQNQDRNRKLEREQQRHLLAQRHAYQNFQLQDRRLRAEGDVLALMELRENFDLEQQQRKESADLGERQEQETNQVESRERQQDLQQRLRELDADIAERQQGVQDSYREELAQLKQANAEKEVALRENYVKQQQEAVKARDERLIALGKSLQDEKDLTKDGMEQIYEAMKEVMGVEGPADTLMKSFNERTKDGFEGLINGIKDQLNGLAIEAVAVASRIQQGVALSSEAYRAPRTGTSTSTLGPRPIPMRQGGVGVVQGPATFAVEPGQREAVMFAPLPTGGGGEKLDVNMSGGFNISGAEVAGRAATEAALDRMVEEFSIAVRKKRGTRG